MADQITTPRKSSVLRWLIACAVAVLICAIYIGIVVPHSLWFLRALTNPNSSTDISLSLNRRALKSTAGYMESILPADTESAVQSFLRYSVTVTGDRIVIAGIPSLTGQLKAPQALLNAGWHVKRKGIVTYVSNTAEEPSVSYISALKQYLIGRVLKHQTAHPVAIASLAAGALPGADKEYAAIALTKGKSVNIYANFGSQDIPTSIASTSTAPDQNNGQEKNLFIAIPSQVLESAPEEIMSGWDTALKVPLGFMHTTPTLIQDMSESQKVIIAHQGSDIAIGAVGTQSAITANIQHWLFEEASYLSPVKKSFRLPDGTIGQEYVPEAPASVLKAPQDGCQETEYHTPTLWVCTQGQTTMLTTSRDLASQLFQTVGDDHWHIILGSPYVSFIPINDIQNITASGDSVSATITITHQ